MSATSYMYNPETGLWYPTVLAGTGDDIHTVIDSNGGITTPPPYVAPVGSPLITTDAYLCFTQTAALPAIETVWTIFACTVSDLIEGYCRKSWRTLVEEVPLSVQMATAFIIRDLIVNKSSNQGLYKSYSGGDYSWTMADGVTPGDMLAPYKAMLNQYRELSIYA